MATILPDYLMDNATAIRSGAASAANMTTGVDAASGVGAGLGAYLGAGTGLLNAYNTFSANSQILNTDAYTDYYKQFGAQTYKGDFNSLVAQRRNSYLSAAPSWRKIRGMTSGQKTSSAITSAASGAMAGAGFGPWGVGIGALIGLGASLLGSARGDSEAQERAEELAREREKALADNQAAYLTGLDNATADVHHQAMANISAFGGPLDFGFIPVGGAIDYELAQKRLQIMDNKNRDKNPTPIYALGGPLHSNGVDWTNGLILVDQGGTHEENPNEGVQMGVAPDGTPNLVEEGEVIWNDYVFSNRIKVPEDIKKKYKLRGSDDMTFADAARKAQKPSAERPNDLIEMRSLEDIMSKLMVEQESIRQKKAASSKKFAHGGHLGLLSDGLGDNPQWLKGLRFIPAVGAGIGVATDLLGLTNKPDYSHADSIRMAAENAANGITDVSFTPVGNYLTYKPFDRFFYTNQLGAQSAATRRAIRNNSNGNRATAIAGLLAADFNAQTQLGNLFRQAEEYNLGQRERVENFNRATNEFNSEGFLKAAMANAENSQKKASILVSAAEKAAALKQVADDRAGAARSANLTNLFDSLGDIGREAFAMDMIKNNRGLLYDWMGRYKGKLLDDADGKPKACGGFLTIKKKRRK